MTAPFQMVGDPTAAACVGDVCEIPQAVTDQAATDQDAAGQAAAEQLANPVTSHLSQHARVTRQLDEDLV